MAMGGNGEVSGSGAVRPAFIWRSRPTGDDAFIRRLRAVVLFSVSGAWPLDPARSRVALYNLYHVLNHFNLFGGGYSRQALDMIQRLLAELK